MTRFERADMGMSEIKRAEIVRDSVRLGHSVDVVNRVIDEQLSSEVWLNDRYQVVVRRDIVVPNFPSVHWLSIKRLDRECVHDWRDLQLIKNELVGPDHEGFELYSAEWRLVDSANQYHLFVFVSSEDFLPVGFFERLVGVESVGGSKQRPFASGGVDL